MNSASAWLRCASSAARRRCIAGSRSASPTGSARTTRSSSPPASTPTAALFEPLLGAEDAIISDALNHASIIDGVRLCKAKRYRFANSDMDELEARLKEADADGARFKLIATDGVFSMDGYVAKLDGDLRPRGALRRVRHGRRLPRARPSRRTRARHAGADRRRRARRRSSPARSARRSAAAMGGFIAAPQPVIDMLRQRARPYLFSNSLAPPVAAGALKAIDIAEAADDKRAHLMRLVRTIPQRHGGGRLRASAGRDADHPGDAARGEARAGDGGGARRARRLCRRASSIPVVPKGKARIRTQMSAAPQRGGRRFRHRRVHGCGKELGIV